MNAYLGDNNVIVIDNARIHYDNELMELLEGLGCHVIFLDESNTIITRVCIYYWYLKIKPNFINYSNNFLILN